MIERGIEPIDQLKIYEVGTTYTQGTWKACL